MSENILCFPSALIKEFGEFEGFSANYQQFLARLWESDYLEFKERNSDLESDPSWKQIIPYIAIKCKDKYFTVQRSKQSGEGRLVGLRTCCIGGHINDQDIDLDNFRWIDAYLTGLEREVDEELVIQGAAMPWVRGLINDNSNSVGQVHFGIFEVISVDYEDDVAVREVDKLVNPEWLTPEEMKMRSSEFENWSQLVIANL